MTLAVKGDEDPRSLPVLDPSAKGPLAFFFDLHSFSGEGNDSPYQFVTWVNWLLNVCLIMRPAGTTTSPVHMHAVGSRARGL